MSLPTLSLKNKNKNLQEQRTGSILVFAEVQLPIRLRQEMEICKIVWSQVFSAAHQSAKDELM